jgi:endonuclease/exonuclease/phosphatase (EEP) superfamily protein YafD
VKSPLDSSSAPEHPQDHKDLTFFGFSHGFILLVVTGLLVALGLRFFARHSWFCELSTAFTLPQFGLSVVALGILIALRAWRSCIPALIALLWLGALVAPFSPWRNVRPADTVGMPVRVLLTNVLTINRDFSSVRELIEQTHPDVICAQEIDHNWEAQFLQFKEHYPYHKSVPRSDNFGIGLWSRFPMSETRILELGDSTVPAIFARLDVNGTPVNLLTVHTLPPLLKAYADTRNTQIAALPRIAAESGKPLVIVGDLNITPWSPYFQDMIAQSGLHSARQGYGLYATWPSNNAWFPALCPIDHILVTEDITVADLTRGPRIGSDHFPIWADLLIPPASPAAG